VATPLAVVVGEIVPHCAAEHETAQETPLVAGSLATLAVNCEVVPTSTGSTVAVTVTVIGGTVTAIVAEADFEESATAVAVMVTVKPAVGALLRAV
jgi:hypothetical protein